MSSVSDQEDYKPDGYHPESEQESFQQYRRRVEKYDQNSIQGKWSEQESLQYVLFMDYHYKIFSSKEKRKTTRIFKSLSKFLTTRTPRQCRSHFQKLMTKFKTLKKVKAYYQEELGLVQYQQKYDSVANKIKVQSPKSDQSEEKQVASSNTVAIQTDPMNIKISDLPQSQFKKLMQIVQEQNRSQFPFWMTHPVHPMGMYPFPSKYQ